MNDSNRPRHCLNPRYQDYDLDFDPTQDEVAEPYTGTSSATAGLGNSSEEHISEPVAAEPAAVVAVEGTWASDKNHHSDAEIFGETAESVDPDTSGLPMRGLVMILSAVGLALVGWATYTMIGGNNNEQHAVENNQTTHKQQPAPEQPAAPVQPASPAEHPADQPPVPNPSSETPAPANDPAKSPATGPANAQNNGPAVDPAKEYVAVLNNSPIQGLAQDVANKIKTGEFKSTGFGNLPDATFPESVVLYPATNDGTRKAAEKLAHQLGIRAEPRTPEINHAIDSAQMLEGAAPGQIVVITTNNMPH